MSPQDSLYVILYVTECDSNVTFVCLVVVLQLEELAADALAYKTSAANQQQRKQAPQSVDTAAAAAALLAAEYPDHGEDMGECTVRAKT
jgi:hypothetical protein